MTNEQRSRNFDGTTVGSWVEMITRVARCLCWRIMDKSESVRREDVPDWVSERYCQIHLSAITRIYAPKTLTLWASSRTTSFPAALTSASTKRPRMRSKKPQADDPSMNGDERLSDDQSWGLEDE